MCLRYFKVLVKKNVDVKDEMEKLEKMMEENFGKVRGESSKDKSSNLEDLIEAVK